MVAPILDHMTALSDPTRCRMLLLLEKHELTVSELCAVLQMPQSSVSRHLKTLADDDWVASRRDGTSRFYSMPVDDLDSGAEAAVAAHSRAGRVHARRRAGRAPAARRAERDAGRSRRSSSRSAAGGWDRLRGDLFGDDVLSLGGARADRPDAGRRRPRLRHGTADGNGGAVRAAA